MLLKEGHQLILVSRRRCAGFEEAIQSGQLVSLKIDPSLEDSWQGKRLLESLSQCEGVVNLAGEPIADKRWTANQCKKIKNSRLDTTRHLITAMNRLRRPPRVLVNASAIGYYGTSDQAVFKETSRHGDDFLAEICREWEDLASKKNKATKLCVLRIGIVIGPKGGALGKMLPVFRTGLGGPIGSGMQWMSWIHRTDLCRLILQSLKNRQWSGVINGVSPEPIRMIDFASLLGEVLGRPSFLPVPGPVLKILLGDGARVVLEGQCVKSERLKRLGFSFDYPDLRTALLSSLGE